LPFAHSGRDAPTRSHAAFEAWVRVDNADIGFVRVGQDVKLKLATHPFQKYGMVDGPVQHVSADASEGPRGAEMGASPKETPTARFRAIVALQDQAIAHGGHRQSLAPGMQVQAEIKLGRRTVLEYLLSPVQRAWQEAGRER
jgi:HlyD family secretion protein